MQRTRAVTTSRQAAASGLTCFGLFQWASFHPLPGRQAQSQPPAEISLSSDNDDKANFPDWQSVSSL